MQMKCKAWDREEKEMLTKGFIVWPDGEAELIHPEGSNPNTSSYWTENAKLEILWSTGLKDKNGVEGYQSDKVKGKNGMYEIRWDDDSARFFLFGGVICKDIRLLKEMEIIGNIHETN